MISVYFSILLPKILFLRNEKRKREESPLQYLLKGIVYSLLIAYG